MRSTGVLLSALALVVTAGCTSSLPGDSPEETASTQVTSEAPTSQETEPAEEDEQSPSPSATTDSDAGEHDQREQAGEIRASETHGKLLLTSDGAVSDAEDLHGKIVVGQGGCIAFVPIPEGGRPLALVAPDGSKYDGRDNVTIGSSTFHFGELVDLQGVAEENADYSEADRCGDQIVRVAP